MGAVRLNFVRFRTLPSCKKRIRSILRKEPERQHGAHLDPFSSNPVISSCTKLVKIPSVCPSLQPAQCGNHLTGKEGTRGEDGEAAEARERNRGAAARFSSPFLFYLPRWDTTEWWLAAVCYAVERKIVRPCTMSSICMDMHKRLPCHVL